MRACWRRIVELWLVYSTAQRSGAQGSACGSFLLARLARFAELCDEARVWAATHSPWSMAGEGLDRMGRVDWLGRN